MSAAKRDNQEFQFALPADPAALRSTPRKTPPRPEQPARTLGLQASWNEATAGGDPYNNSRVRTRA